MSNTEKAQDLFERRKTLLMEMERLGELQENHAISYEEFVKRFKEKNQTYQELLEESERLGFLDKNSPTK